MLIFLAKSVSMMLIIVMLVKKIWGGGRGGIYDNNYMQKRGELFDVFRKISPFIKGFEFIHAFLPFVLLSVMSVYILPNVNCKLITKFHKEISFFVFTFPS